MSFPTFPGRKMNRIDKPNVSVKLYLDIIKLLTRLKTMLKGYKTFVVGTLAILGALGAYLTGDMAAVEAVQIAVTAALSMTVRNAIPEKK